MCQVEKAQCEMPMAGPHPHTFNFLSELQYYYISFVSLCRVVQAIQSPAVAPPLTIPNLDEDTRSYVWGDDNRTALPEHLDDFLSFDGPAWGATVSFSMDELDLLGGLEGFMEPVPETLRRWVCYQTLLGRLRHR